MNQKLFTALADAMKNPAKVALFEADMKIAETTKAREIVHMVGEHPVKLTLGGEDVHTRCGIIGAPVSAGPAAAPHRYTLINSEGNQFFGTTLRAIVSCKKCTNLIEHGKIHGE